MSTVGFRVEIFGVSICPESLFASLVLTYDPSDKVRASNPSTNDSHLTKILPFIAASGFPYKVLRYTGALVAACAMILLQLRTYALYSKSKKVICLFCVLNIVAVSFFVVQATLLTSSSKDNAPVATFKPLPRTLHSSIYWSPFLLNEMVTFSLAVVKLVKIRMDFENAKLERSLNLTRTLIRDNMIYFSVIFIVYASGLFLLIDLQIEEACAGTFTLASIAVSGIMAPNLLLMLKKIL
ncbi:hypothetical protein ACEPAI_3596 [Sanghuangporus weigelae]